MSICNGIDNLIRYHLSLSRLDAKDLLKAMLICLEANWTISPRRLAGKRPSVQNWRFQPKLTIAAHNESPEKTLEKAIVNNPHLVGWVNQVPTASGLFDQHSDKHRNVDLVRRLEPRRYEFIELKVGSDTPHYAALEILLYAALYIFSRLHYTEAEKQAQELLQAEMIHLRVLAPQAYYRSGVNLGELTLPLNEGLQAIIKTRNLDWQMDFKFLVFPPTFIWPCDQETLRRAVAEIILVS
jgi:hypothetical protein